MKRHKRDRDTRAYTRGYQAGLEGKSQDICPFGAPNPRYNWISGWREGRTDQIHGYTGVASVHNLKNMG
ncbi:MAG: ribosome modulation factor [Gammaproteobacteria bacterium HGW-Gammaproteobacteria-14]|nr:MAG: ribosome modulation factor [Gammaproteobacteria bacterium HGW-Gammaproteobacteria-14]